MLHLQTVLLCLTPAKLLCLKLGHVFRGSLLVSRWFSLLIKDVCSTIYFNSENFIQFWEAITMISLLLLQIFYLHSLVRLRSLASALVAWYVWETLVCRIHHFWILWAAPCIAPYHHSFFLLETDLAIKIFDQVLLLPFLSAFFLLVLPLKQRYLTCLLETSMPTGHNGI